MNSLQCVERSLVPKAKISSTTHVQLQQWLHGKQQQHRHVLAYRLVEALGGPLCPSLRTARPEQYNSCLAIKYMQISLRHTVHKVVNLWTDVRLRVFFNLTQARFFSSKTVIHGKIFNTHIYFMLV